MSRKRAAEKRRIEPDPRFSDGLLAKFVNVFMVNGKKAVAQRIIYKALQEVQRRGHENPLEVFHQALQNIQPTMEVKSRRIGGANYQVPVEVRADRAKALSMRWLKLSLKNSSGRTSSVNVLATEIIEASAGRGFAMKKKEESHKMAAANRAFSHFRF